MRILLAILIWVIFVGGLWMYMEHRDSIAVDEIETIEVEAAQDKYDIEVSASFLAAPDPFALQVDDTQKSPAIVLRLGKIELLNMVDNKVSGEVIRLENIKGLVKGNNELFIEASPTEQNPGLRNFVQLRVLHDNNEIAEETFWSDSGAKVIGSLMFEVEESKDHAHEH